MPWPNIPDQGTHPFFWDPNDPRPENPNTFENNALWIREFMHGCFEAANHNDFIRLRRVLKVGAKAIMENMPDTIDNLNDAYQFGMRVGHAILTEANKP